MLPIDWRRDPDAKNPFACCGKVDVEVFGDLFSVYIAPVEYQWWSMVLRNSLGAEPWKPVIMRQKA